MCRSSPARRWCPAAKAKLPESTWNLRKWREQFPPNLKTFVVFFSMFKLFQYVSMMKQVTDLSEVPKTGGRCKGYLDDLLGNVLYKLLLPVLFFLFQGTVPIDCAKTYPLKPGQSCKKSLSLYLFVYNLYMYLSESNCTCIYLPYLESIICLFKI